MTPAIEAVWPLTALQRALTAHAGLTGSTPDAPRDPYVGQTCVRLTGPLDATALERALDALLDAHPNLRAGFAVDDELDPVQFVPAHAPAEVVWYDAVPGAGDAEGNARTTAPVGDHDGAPDDEPGVPDVLAAERALPFDPADPPLLRFAVLRRGVQDHVLVVTSHHLVLDGWSMPVLVRELARVYGEELATLAKDEETGGDAQQGPLPSAARGRYQDHLAWLDRQDAAAAGTAWREVLGGARDGSGGTTWPIGEAWGSPTLPRTLRATLDAPTAAGLRDAARSLRTTPAALVRTAWGLVVAGHAGSGTALVAVPVAVRSVDVEHADEIVGMLTETVLARVDAPAGASLADVVAAHTATWTATLPHQHAGLRGIRAALGGEGPLARTLVSFEEHTATSVMVGDLELRLVRTADATDHPLALAVTARDAGDAWDLALDTDDAVLEPAVARGVLDGVLRLLHTLARDPGARVADLDLDGGRQRAVLTGAAAPTSVVPPPVSERFDDAVARHPDAVALVVGRRQQTFAELDASVRDAEERLARAGARTGDALAVDLPRDERTVHVVLAALRRGLAVTPLPRAAPERREHVLRISGAAVLWDDAGPRALTGAHETAAPGARDLLPRLHGTGLLATTGSIIFTSGSTGEPKGVAVGQRALAHLLARHEQDLYTPGERLRVAHTAAFTFDAHFDAFLALAAGHELHVLDEDVFLDPVALREYVTEQRIDYLDFTPTVWSALLASGGWSTLPRICVVGGEAFGPALWTRMGALAARTGSRVVNLYGPTEATVDALAADVRDSDVPVVGRPVGATRALVLDAALRRVPPGTIGELYLAGPQLADGYLGQPGLTASRFVAATDAPGERMYRTGDLARYAPDGTVTLLGRNDDQISLHGFRVEPGEVEQVLVAAPGVAGAAVVVAQHPRLGDRLVAYVVPSTAAGERWPSPDELRAWAAARVARHLVPSAVVVLPHLPLTANGKLDRGALPAPAWGQRSDAGTSTAHGAQSPFLTIVLAAVTRVLGAPIGVDESFFAAGGDSIDALQLVAALRRAGLCLSPADLFAARTPAAMARLCLPERAAGGTGDVGDADTSAGAPRETGSVPHGQRVLVPLTADQATRFDEHVRRTVPGATRVVDVLPLTATQLGMVADAAREGDDAYRTSTRFTVRGARSEDVVAAVGRLLRRHPHLRGGVLQLDLPQPVLYVPDAVDVPCEEVDATHVSAEDLAGLLDALDEAHRGRLDLLSAPLVSCALVRTGEEHVLVLASHHLLTDGWSVPLLAADLRELVASRARGSGSDESTRSPSFRDYLAWLADAEASRPEAEAVWRAELAGARPTRLARPDVPAGATSTRAASPSDRAARVVRSIDLGDRTGAVRDAARRADVTSATIVAAAWGLVLSALTASPDVLLGTTVAGRPTDLEGADEIVGLLVSTSPLRVPCGDHRDGDALLADVRDRQGRVMGAHHLGLGAIARLGPDGSGSLFDTLLVVENYPRSPGASVSPVSVTPTGGYDATHYPVTVTVLPTDPGGPGDHLTLEVEERPGALPAAVSDVLVPALSRALDALVAGGPLPAPAALVGSGLVGAAAPAPPVVPAGPVVPGPQSSAAVSGAVPARSRATDVAPAEVVVREEMARVLGEDTASSAVDTDTDFFTAGGDSIAAMQLVGALRGRGLVVTVGAVFSERTPRGIACASRAEQVRTGAQDDAGPLPLLPSLAWLARAGGDARRFVQVRVLRTPAGLDADTLRAALDSLVAAHGAFRLVVDDAGARVAPRGSTSSSTSTLTVLPAPAPEDAMTLDDAVRGVVREIDPATGDVLRAVWLPGRPASPTRTAPGTLVLVAHHVAVDAVSWRILVDDLRALCAGQLLPAPSATLREAALAQHAELPALHADVARWVAVHDAAALDLLARPLDPARDTVAAAAARERVVRFSPEVTRRVLAAGARTDHVLLAALRDATAHVGAPTLVVDVEGHGRALDGRGPDMSRTVGWFTATWPVRLRAEAVAGAGAGAGAGAHLRRTAEQVEDDGRGYGQLRYLDPVAREALDAAACRAPAQVLVNYLGRETTGTGDWGSAGDAADLESRLGLHADLPLSHGLELNAYVTGENPVLVARWLVAPAADTVIVDALVDAWERGVHRLVADVTDVPHDAPWPLTALQRGMVFHAGTQDTDPYVSAVDLGLDGPLDVAALRSALGDVLAAHPQLRLALADDAGSPAVEPRLVVTDRTDVPVREIHLASDTLVGALVADELGAPFDLTRAPLLRAVVVHLGADAHRLVLTNHHLLLDGWSVPLLVDEVLAAYAARVTTADGRIEGAPRALVLDDTVARALAARSSRTDRADTAQWSAVLADAVTAPVTDGDDPPAATTGTLVAEQGADLGDLLLGAARAASATPSDVVLTAWGVVLAAATDAPDAVLGTTVSGRPAEVPGSDRALGMFINTVPVRVPAGSASSLGDLVRTVHRSQAALRAVDHVGLADIQRSLGRGNLLDTLVVVENYPREEAQPAASAGLTLTDVRGDDRTHFPLALTVDASAGLHVQLDHAGIGHERASSFLDALLEVLALAGHGPERAVADVLADLVTRWPGLRAIRRAAGETSRAPDGRAPCPVATVRTAFAAVLGAPVGSDDNFFALGGDSIVAMRLTSVLRDAGWRADARRIFAHPTPAALAAHLTPVTATAAVPAPTAAHVPLVAMSTSELDELDELLRNVT